MLSLRFLVNGMQCLRRHRVEYSRSFEGSHGGCATSKVEQLQRLHFLLSIVGFGDKGENVVLSSLSGFHIPRSQIQQTMGRRQSLVFDVVTPISGEWHTMFRMTSR